MGPNSEEEGVEYNTNKFEMYFVCSHGGSIKRPVLIGVRHAKWLKSEGVIVYSEEEYKKALKEHQEGEE